MSSPREFILKSSDKESFEVEEGVALESQTTKHVTEDECANDGILLPNVTSKILSKVIEYCKKHLNADRASSVANDDLKSQDVEFIEVD